MTRVAPSRRASPASSAALPAAAPSLAATSARPGRTGQRRFEEIPPARSGITWVHDNAMSEPLPAGDVRRRLRVPRLRQRRLDGHLPRQQRPVRLLHAEDAAPQRPLPQQPRRHLHRRHREGRRRRRHASAWAWRSATTTTTASPTSSSPPTARALLYHNNGDGTFTDVTEKAGLRAARLDDERGLVRLRQRRPARPVRLQLRRVLAEDATSSAATTSSGERYYCIPRVFNPTASFLFHNNGDGTFTDVSQGTDIAARPRQGPRRRRHRRQQRRPDGPVRRQRHGAELPVHEPRQGASGRRSASPPKSASRPTASRARAWAWTPPTSTRTAGEDLFVANVDQEMFSLYRNRGNESFQDVAHANGVAAGHPPAERLGPEVLRLRQRRPPRPAAGQRPSRRHDRGLLAAGEVQGAAAAVPQRGRPADATSARESGPVFAKSFAARGLAVGDFDNDGRLDVLVANNGEAPAAAAEPRRRGTPLGGPAPAGHDLQPRRRGRAHHLVGRAASTRRRLKTGGGSYLSSHDPREVLGLGTATTVDWVEVDVAAAERQSRAPDQRADRPLRAA